MYYKKEESEYGDTKDANGERYNINECNAAHTPQGLNVGYTFFATRQECLDAWGLVDIPEEELFPSIERAEQ